MVAAGQSIPNVLLEDLITSNLTFMHPIDNLGITHTEDSDITIINAKNVVVDAFNVNLLPPTSYN